MLHAGRGYSVVVTSQKAVRFPTSATKQWKRSRPQGIWRCTVRLNSTTQPFRRSSPMPDITPALSSWRTQCRECDGRGTQKCPVCDEGVEYDHDKGYLRNCAVCRGTEIVLCSGCFGTGESDTDA